MKTVAVSPRAKALNSLLKSARRGGVILKSSDGHRFVLAALGDWQGFNVGNGDDFTRETAATVRNRKLIKALAERRSGGKRVPLADVKKQLGLK